jgi:antitoxin (DNA-binding transcriptional repressor) of toxin-antitoxin stability system
MKATICDLRYRTKDVLAAVDRGEAVTVLYRGKEKALLMPLAAGRQNASVAPGKAFGMWRDRRDLRDVSGYVRKLRRGRFHGL